jgi:hypothetical protein
MACRFRARSIDVMVKADVGSAGTIIAEFSMRATSNRSNALLWTAQILLAALFAFAGVVKLMLPAAALEQGPIVLPALFLRFIGVAELAGALGLLLPGWFGVQRQLTWLAAAGLVLIMIGATVLTALGSGVGAAAFPGGVGVVAATVAIHRRATWSGSHRLAAA